jgi:hypothetical protein
MKCGFVIVGLALLLVGCNPTDGCRSHADEASCVADKACQWKAEKNKCKAAKKEKKSPQSEKTTAPAPSGLSAVPGANYSLPSTETQPQPTYPEGE